MLMCIIKLNYGQYCLSDRIAITDPTSKRNKQFIIIQKPSVDTSTEISVDSQPSVLPLNICNMYS